MSWITISSIVCFFTLFSVALANDEHLSIPPHRVPKFKSPISAASVAPSARFLQESSRPIHYDIEVTPYFDDEGDKSFKFDGKTVIQFKVNEEKRNTLRLHAEQLTFAGDPVIRDVSLQEPRKLRVTKTSEDAESSMFQFTFNETLSKGGIYEIEFNYEGVIGEGSVSNAASVAGLYRSSFIEDGKTVWMVNTQLQKNYARRVFPSFDEPMYKATFSITVNKLKNYEVISNMNPIGEPITIPNDDKRNKITFKKTPVMPCYLVAIIVAPLTRRQSEDNKYSVWTQRNLHNYSDYAFDFGQRALNYFNEYTDIDYFKMTGMEKLDMAAIPWAGGMENWGLIIYRAETILYYPGETTAKTKSRAAQLITHEVAHQWFGNLVTCESWEYFWLNEGFATYFQYFISEELEKEQRIADRFLVEVIQDAFEIDTEESTRALSDHNAPGLISYMKGAAVIRMIELYIGADAFKTAMRNYLKKYSYSSVIAQNVFQNLNSAGGSDKPVTDYFMSWTTQPGYPVIYVSYVDDETIEVTQKRFLYQDPRDLQALQYKWTIPITFLKRGETSKSLEPSHFFRASDDVLTIKTDVASDWILFNIDNTGYYRVNYDNKLWDRLLIALHQENFDGISEINRAQIVGNALNFARSDMERITYKTVLQVVDYLKYEDGYLPWATAFSHFRKFLFSRMEPESLQAFFAYLAALSTKVYNKLSFEATDGEDAFNSYNRGDVIQFACQFGNTECRATASEYFAKFKLDPVANKIPTDIEGPVLCSAMRTGSLEDFNFLWERYFTEIDNAKKNLMLFSLGCSQDIPLLEEYLDITLTDDSISPRTALSIIFNMFLTESEYKFDHFTPYFVTNIEKFHAKFENFALSIILYNFINGVNVQDNVDKLEAFFDENKEFLDERYEETTKAAFTDAAARLEWNRKNIPIIIKEIQKEGMGSTAASATFISIGVLVIAFVFFFFLILIKTVSVTKETVSDTNVKLKAVQASSC